MLLYVPTVVNGVPENAVCLCSFRWYGVQNGGISIETADGILANPENSEIDRLEPNQKDLTFCPLQCGWTIDSGVRSPSGDR